MTTPWPPRWLRRAQPVWGLRSTARVSWDRARIRVDAADRQDAHLALGYAHAALALPSFDLARRLWSGRLGEVLGDRGCGPGLTILGLDRFFRILDLRRDAERRFRALDPGRRAPLEAFCRGVNAYIDTGRWARDLTYPLLETRPRFWAPADALLLAEAPRRIEGLRWTDPPPEYARLVQHALAEPALRGPGGVAHDLSMCVEGSLMATGPFGIPPGFEPPEVVADVRLRSVQILPGDGGQRYLDPDDLQPRRFSVERVDLAERGGAGWTGEVRRALVSDLWGGPPTLWQWAGPARAVLLPQVDEPAPPDWSFIRTLPSQPFDWALEPRR